MSRTAEFEAGHRLNRSVDAPSLAGPQFNSYYRGRHEGESGVPARKLAVSEQDAYDERRWSRYE